MLIPLPAWWVPSLPELKTGAVGTDVDKELYKLVFQASSVIQLCPTLLPYGL